MDELREIIQVTRVAIASAYYVGGITVTAEIGRNDVKSISKSLCNPVPIMTVVSVAMHKQQWRRVRVSPVQVMETESLTIVRVRRGSGSC